MNPCERPILEMPQTSQTVCIIFFAVAVILAIWYALHVAKKGNVSYPIWMIFGTLAATAYETQDALLGHFVYPQMGQITAFQLHDRPMPLYLILIYVVYVAPLLTLIFDKMENRSLTPSAWWKIYLGCIVAAFCFEPPWIHFGLWRYWGDNQPLKVFGLPLWWIFANPAAIMCMGVFCCLIWRNIFQRRHAYLLTILVPASLFAFHGAVSAPVFCALGTFTTKTGPVVASVMSTALSLLAMWISQKVLEKELKA